MGALEHVQGRFGTEEHAVVLVVDTDVVALDGV